MGGQESIVYNVPVTQKIEGQSAIYRHPNTKDKLTDRPAPGLGTMKDVILNSYQKFANLNALGTYHSQLGKIVKKQNKSQIEYLTYKEAIEQGHHLGSGIIHQQLFNQPEGEKIKLLGIFSKNRIEWALTDYACLLFNIVTIPLYDTLGDENITYVFEHTHMQTVFVNDGSLKALMKCKDLVKINKIVCFDTFTQEESAFFNERGAKLILFSQVLSMGKQKPVDYNQQEYKVVPEDCLTFCYTSGTTGPPKGAMLSHKNFASFMGAENQHADTKFNSNDVVLSYLPLPHILERQFDYSFWHKGGAVVYFSGDVQKLKDDLALVKPTVFVSVPRLFSRFYDVLKQKFSELTGWTKTALEYALQTKISNLKSTGSYQHRVYDKIFFAKTKEALGGRCRLMISGSAPLLPEVQQFLKVVLCAPFVQAYGSTESTGAFLSSTGRDPTIKIVGGPISNFELKLVDIPEMSYRSTDTDDQGKLTPRGEIWGRGPGVFMGYYNNKQKTEQALSQDGWLRTGDVGIMSADTKAISIIDRKKNIFKLQQGEYVAAQKVQNIYAKCPYIAQCFIHGDSTQTFAIGIFVPNPKTIKELAESKGVEGSLEQVCKNVQIRTEVTSSLNKVGKQAGLMSFQQPKNIYLEPVPFLNKGILTNTMKVQRHEAKKVYRPIIDELYKQGMLKMDKK